MKCNIMSFVLAIEALKQYKEENQALVQNVHYKKISNRINNETENDEKNHNDNHHYICCYD